MVWWPRRLVGRGIVVFREVNGCDALIWLFFAALCAASVVGLSFEMSDGGNSTRPSGNCTGE